MTSLAAGLPGLAGEPGRPPSRVLRGGSWNNTAQNLRSANRNNNSPGNRNNNNGFRVASTPAARIFGATAPRSAPWGVQGRP
jgi:formylglycine-generating enzyme required for sulfatase activity